MQLHQQHAKDGLVLLSVSVDRAEDRGKALEFVRGQQATNANYWIDEKEAFWQDKFDMNAPPVVFVFDRQGKRAAKFETDPRKPAFKHADLEKLVQQLLKEN